jgi:hypothetical protein
MVSQLRHVNKVVLGGKNEWYESKGDAEGQLKRAVSDETDAKYEECVLRFNRCQSVLPGSPHPEKEYAYTFVSYNDGVVADAPDWVLDVLRPLCKPVRWLNEADLAELNNESSGTSLPLNQMRGFFYGDKVQQLLLPKLQDLIFKHEVFDQYGWALRPGGNPQYMSGCPWHDSASGTAFQYNPENGCWDCKACGVGGDSLAFVHKIKSGDMLADWHNAPAVVIEGYIAEIVEQLGFSYPADANVKHVVDTPKITMDSDEFFRALVEIRTTVENPATMLADMAALAAATGRRMTGTECIKAVNSYSYFEDSKDDTDEDWKNCGDLEFLLPNLMMRPSQVLLHSGPGVGKTSAAMGLARMVGKSQTMKIRGIDYPLSGGPVLWVQNDQPVQLLKRNCEDNGIDLVKDTWFIVKNDYQIDHIHRMVKWIRQHKPALVVIDSLGSCSMHSEIDERDKAFAAPLYEFARNNGRDKGTFSFPACSILWLHHDNANGEARGSRYVSAAVDEQWHMHVPSEEQRVSLHAAGHKPANSRLITIKKSRAGRTGDTLVAERDANYSYTLSDLTRTAAREQGGDADSPQTMVLRIIHDSVTAADSSVDGAMTATQILDVLTAELTGAARGTDIPAKRSVERWLTRWNEDGVLTVDVRKTGEKHRPSRCYSTPHTPLSTFFNNGVAPVATGAAEEEDVWPTDPELPVEDALEAPPAVETPIDPHNEGEDGPAGAGDDPWGVAG